MATMTSETDALLATAALLLNSIVLMIDDMNSNHASLVKHLMYISLSIDDLVAATS